MLDDKVSDVAFLGRTTGNLTLSGMLARFRRPPTRKIPLQPMKRVKFEERAATLQRRFPWDFLSGLKQGL